MMTESKLNAIYELIEKAVYDMSEESELNVLDKGELIDTFFNKLIEKCDIEIVT